VSKVIIFRLNTTEEYEQWYEFLNWIDYPKIPEISSWDDRSYSGTMYKAYKIDSDQDLTYILLKWAPILKGEYAHWMELRDHINKSVYRDEDLVWIDKDV